MTTKTARSTALALLVLTLFAGRASADDPLSYNTQAHQLMKAGEYDKALNELRTGVSLYPYEGELRQTLRSTYVFLAQRDLDAGRFIQAADCFGQAHELFPDDQQLAFQRGEALFFAKKYDAARAEFEEAGDRADALTYLGKISYDTGNLTAALEYWRAALNKDPGNAMVPQFIKKAERELPVESKMDKGYSSMFDLGYDAELPPGLSAEVLDALESAYNTVGNDLGLFPTTRIPVLLYTKKEYSSVTGGPDWSGGLYDGKIRLPVGGITTLNKQLRAVIFHEYTHVVIAEITHGNIPTWLNEGLAEIEGRKELSHPIVDLDKAAKGGKLIPLKTLSGSFLSMGGDEAGLAYEQSYSMANFMVNTYGWYAVQAILKSLGEQTPIEKAVAKGLADWSLDLPAMTEEWRQSFK